jgi:phosphoribosyl 1,2-cyclic phosphodiesterase
VRVFVLGTGSSGNALLLESNGTRVLVDAGVGPRKTEARLERLGMRFSERAGDRIDAIVATHEHGDHFGEIGSLARAFGATIWMHRRIDSESARRVRSRFDVQTYDPGRPFRIGSLVVEAEPIPHDAPQVAVRVAEENGGPAIGVATDVGRITNGLVGLLAQCDAALVEANHCAEMLAFGPYPDRLKKRVSGGLGHLNNDDTAELARRLEGSRLTRLWLGHLSKANNTPERALEVVASRAKGIDVEVLPHGHVCALDVRRKRPAQLALPF